MEVIPMTPRSARCFGEGRRLPGHVVRGNEIVREHTLGEQRLGPHRRCKPGPKAPVIAKDKAFPRLLGESPLPRTECDLIFCSGQLHNPHGILPPFRSRHHFLTWWKESKAAVRGWHGLSRFRSGRANR